MSLCPHRHEFSSSKFLKLLAMEKANIQKTVSLSKSLHSAGDFYAWMIRNKAVPAAKCSDIWPIEQVSLHQC